ncbi:hypothetical protein [Persicobacter diffluens]|uniref:DUF1104 domain-containing protein n=1 Tax=Persicobacter diffluens TaxID=981 RepID=A0AAN5AKH0_9BACT|nr:hypothetical protein PEDI_23790 [Persicobacter diffluens]
MKKIIQFPLFALLFISTVVFADIKPKKLQQLEKDVATMTDVMGLNADQQAKILEAKKTVFLENQDVLKNHEKGSEEFKAAKKANNQKYSKALRSIASKDQMKAWQEYRKNNK